MALPIKFKVCFAIDHPRGCEPEYSYVRYRLVPTTYEYFTNLDLRCIVAKLPSSGLVDDEYCEQAAARVPLEQLQNLLDSQEALPSKSFHALWPCLDPVRLMTSPTDTSGLGTPSYVLPPIHHYTATTVVANCLRKDAIAGNVEIQKAFLRNALSGGISLDDPIYLDAK
ncbi:hypothetical protein TARUN_7569 [Trichoderma arundinaceum]|uniref:Uncharacterized protein n=1 Tax=Trichoderma arundinaceum TaxID=490622 RepID=A0A395NFN4_TRIAR|nr:hypothetical protein TARUN_7569 [Trichoderma arundinaceum]